MSDPREFTNWFFEHELASSSGMGVAIERAQLHLERSLTFLELGMIREALDEANVAAHLDPELRPRALLVARLCVLRELADDGVIQPSEGGGF